MSLSLLLLLQQFSCYTLLPSINPGNLQGTLVVDCSHPADQVLECIILVYYAFCIAQYQYDKTPKDMNNRMGKVYFLSLKIGSVQNFLKVIILTDI